MHSLIFGWQKKIARRSCFFLWYIILTVGLGKCLDLYLLKIYGNLKAGKERAFRTRRRAVSLQIGPARYILWEEGIQDTARCGFPTDRTCKVYFVRRRHWGHGSAVSLQQICRSPDRIISIPVTPEWWRVVCGGRGNYWPWLYHSHPTGNEINRPIG